MLHITPAEVDRLPVEEFDLLCGWIDEYQRQSKAAANG